MDEIHVERKSASIWPWLLALAAVIAVVLIWVAVRDDAQPEQDAAAVAEAPGAPRAATTGPGGGAVGEYLAFAGVEAGSDPPEMGRDHEYTAEGIRRLGAALNELVDRNGNAESRSRFERFREAASRIQQDPTSAQHANLVREAFTRAADVIGSLENTTSAGRLQSIAESISPDQPLLEQREKVQTFFRESAEAIRTAARS